MRTKNASHRGEPRQIIVRAAAIRRLRNESWKPEDVAKAFELTLTALRRRCNNYPEVFLLQLVAMVK